MIKKSLIFNLIIFSLGFTCVSYANSKLIFAATMIRHGDRTPYQLLQKDPIPWAQGAGQLLPLGMNKEYLLGTKLRKLFITENHLLPNHYNAKTMYVWSGSGDRILMSAESFLVGLYPVGPNLPGTKNPALPHAFQPIPIHTTPVKEDAIINNNVVQKTDFDDALKQYSYQQAAWTKRVAEAKTNHDFARWTAILGQPITNLADMIPLGDNINVRMLNHVSLPTDPDTGKPITQAEGKSLAVLSKWGEMQQYAPKPVGCLVSIPFFQDLSQHIQAAKSAKSQIKYVLYSAHDSNLLGVMSALGKPVNGKAYPYPPYAAHINFLVYKKKNQYTLTITYMGKLVKTMPLPQKLSSVCRTKNEI